jgi:5'-deoxynucleotidase YfbR-like HD superfamily hydrolase
MIKALKLALDGGHVKRYHAKSTLKEETVAEHSYVVAWLVTLGSNYRPSAALLLAALQHDVPECVLGDMPSPTKLSMNLGSAFAAAEAGIFRDAGMPDFAESLTGSERALLKLADNLSGWLKCVHERQLGNTTLANTEANYRDYITRSLDTTPEHTDFVSAVLLAAELEEL